MDKDKLPLLSVLIPTYKPDLKFFRETIDSILNQSFKDFELLILADGPDERLDSFINSFNDSRIILHKLSHAGIANTGNRGLVLAKGQFIVRHDQDDLSHPLRFQRQLEFFNKNSKFGAVGTRTFNIDENGNLMERCFMPGDPELLNKLLFSYNPFTNSSMMLKKEAVFKAQGYTNIPFIDDYDLWLKMRRFCQIGIIEEELFYYRVHGGSASAKNKNKMNQLTAELKINKIIEHMYPMAKRKGLKLIQPVMAKKINLAFVIESKQPELLKKSLKSIAVHFPENKTPVFIKSKDLTKNNIPIENFYFFKDQPSLKKTLEKNKERYDYIIELEEGNEVLRELCFYSWVILSAFEIEKISFEHLTFSHEKQLRNEDSIVGFYKLDKSFPRKGLCLYKKEIYFTGKNTKHNFHAPVIASKGPILSENIDKDGFKSDGNRILSA